MSYFLWGGWNWRSGTVAITIAITIGVVFFIRISISIAIVGWWISCSTTIICSIVSSFRGIGRILVFSRFLDYVSRTALSRGGSWCEVFCIGCAGIAACKFSSLCTDCLLLNRSRHFKVFVFISFMNSFHNLFPNLHMETLT